MQIKLCSSPICRRPFQVNEYTLRHVNTLNKGQIICPHCGYVLSGKSNSVFLTHALTESEEAQIMPRPYATESDR